MNWDSVRVSRKRWKDSHSCLNLSLKAPGWPGKGLSVWWWCCLEIFAKEGWPRFTMILCSQRRIEVVRWTMCHDHYYYNTQICTGSSIVDSESGYCCFDLRALLDKWGILIYSWLKWNIIPALFKCQNSFVVLLHLISSVEITKNALTRKWGWTIYQPQPSNLGQLVQLICHFCLLCILVLF